MSTFHSALPHFDAGTRAYVFDLIQPYSSTFPFCQAAVSPAELSGDALGPRPLRDRVDIVKNFALAARLGVRVASHPLIHTEQFVPPS